MSSETEFDPAKGLYKLIVTKTEKAKAFWAQFLAQKEALFAFESSELIKKSINELLSEYIEGVVVDFVLNQQGQPETMVISANWNNYYFQYVILLVQAAPEIDGIKVQAFRQRINAEERDFSIPVGDVSLSPSDILVSLAPDELNGCIDIQIYINKAIDKEQEEYAQKMFVLMLNLILGEYDTFVRVRCIDFAKTQAEDEEWIPLPELPEVLDKIWEEQLGHTQHFPEEGQMQYASFDYGNEDDNEDSYIYGVVNFSAHSVACRVDLAYCLCVSIALDDKPVEEINKLEKTIIRQIHSTQLGIHILTVVTLDDGIKSVYFHTGDVLASLKILEKTVLPFRDLNLNIGVDIRYEPRWEQYHKWVPAHQPMVGPLTPHFFEEPF